MCLAIATVASLLAGTAQAANGTWERLWGLDVITGPPAVAETCTVAANCQMGSNGALGGEFEVVDDTAVDAAGNIYTADELNNRVQKFDPSGNFLRAWGKNVDDANPDVFGICTDPAHCLSGQTGPLGGELSAPEGVAVDAAGHVFVAETTGARITEFDSSGNFIRTWGAGVDGDTAGTGPEVCIVAASCLAGGNTFVEGGEFQFPTDVAVDSAGNVYVGEFNARHRIQKFDPSGNFLLAWGKNVDMAAGTGFEKCMVAADCLGGDAGTLGGEMDAPRNVATGPAGAVYVSEFNNNRVQKFDSSGNWVSAWGKSVKTAGGAGPAETCDVAADCKAGAPGGLGGELSAPYGLATDAAGDVYVADSANNRIEKFDSSGGFLRAWGKDVDNANLGVFGICTVEADCRAGQNGAFGGELWEPHGISIGSDGAAYVADFQNRRLSKFAGGPILSGSSPASPANDNSPLILGTAVAGSTVTVYAGSACGGPPLATDVASNLSSPGIAVSVPDDSTTTFTATATDAGNNTSECSTSSVTYVEDSTPPDTIIDSAPSGTISTTTPTFTFHATEPSATFECRFDAQAFAPCSGALGTHTPLFPLPDGAHTFEVRARDPVGNADATPAQASFTVNTVVEKPTTLPPPVQGQLVNAIPEKGTVLVKLPDAAKAHAAATGFVPLETVGRQLPVGTTLDTTRGTVLLRAATDAAGGTQDGHFSKGLFRFGQTTKNPLTTLSMTGGGLNACSKLPRGGSKKPVVGAKKRRRTLFSNVKGRFRTRGRNSTATVRGTSWTMTDTCSGTRTTVRAGSVKVRDFALRKTRIVKAGHSYLARAPKVKRKRR